MKTSPLKLALVPVAMFVLGFFGLPPLYNAFCDITGLNGKTGRIESAEVDPNGVDTTRTIEVSFLGNTASGLPWTFEPLVKKMEIHPGQVYEAMYRVRSSSGEKTLGQAIPSVSPGLAASHFNKTECFCFTQQALEGFETRDMPLRFVVDDKIPDNINEITLSYTFFSRDQG